MAKDSKPLTQGQVFDAIMEGLPSDISKKQAKQVFERIIPVAAKELKRAGVFNLLGILKVKAIKKPAVKGGVTKPNPFKPGETMVTTARPARMVVKCLPLKRLKETVA